MVHVIDVWMSSNFIQITAPSPTVFVWFSQNLAHMFYVCQYAQKCGTDFVSRNFDFKMFAKLFKPLAEQQRSSLGQQASLVYWSEYLKICLDFFLRCCSAVPRTSSCSAGKGN